MLLMSVLVPPTFGAITGNGEGEKYWASDDARRLILNK
jgi:hypothetical protein